MKKIKNIIFPTDFSVKKSSIFSYAKALANTLNANITVLNMDNDLSHISTKEHEIELQKNIDIMLNKGDNTLVKMPKKSMILRGPFTNLTLSKRGDLLVVYHSNLPFFTSKMTNSSTLSLSDDVNCPVFLIPDEAKFAPIKQVLFTNDIESVTPATVRTMSDFAEQFDAVAHFVHLPENGEKSNLSIESIWRDLYEKAAVNYPFKLHKIKGSNTVKKLKDYVKKHRINLSAFVNKRRHFWNELMHSKTPQNISFGLGLPVMIMHCNSLTEKTKLSGKINGMFNGYSMEGESHFY